MIQPTKKSPRNAAADPDKPVHTIGLISDTHGLLREEALLALRGSDLIVHAGDVGNPEIIAALKELAPVVAVRGNTDTEAWAQALPETAVAEAGTVSIYVLHDLQQLDLDPAKAGFRVVVTGHTHKPVQVERGGVLYVNPGSAGPRRFNLPITLALLDVRRTPLGVEFIRLNVS